MDETPLSAVLITLNEERKIGAALESLAPVVDEIVVLDSGSRDQTEQICRNFQARFLQQEWLGYRAQKQKATDLATHDWVLSLDADEVLSKDLSREILEWKKRPADCLGYYLPRKAFFLGRWIEHTTWSPDWQLRLFDRRKGVWKGGRVHESVRIEGRTGRLRGILEHYTYSSISEYLIQLENFTSLAAADALDAGKRARWFHFPLLPFSVFLKNYFLRRGCLDGFPGFTVSCLAAVSVYFRYLKLYELQIVSRKSSQ